MTEEKKDIVQRIFDGVKQVYSGMNQLIGKVSKGIDLLETVSKQTREIEDLKTDNRIIRDMVAEIRPAIMNEIRNEMFTTNQNVLKMEKHLAKMTGYKPYGNLED